MWVFLSTEVLFFGGLFMTYPLNRHYYPVAFGVGSNTLDLKLGGLNTVILILSSLTMAMSVWASSVGKITQTSGFLPSTPPLVTAFLGVKVIEYKQKSDHHLVPGYHFQID